MLSKIAIHAAGDQERIRKVKSNKQFSLDALQRLDLPPRAVSQQVLPASEESSRPIYEAIELLPLKCRQAFLLSRIRGMSYAQIAAHCNIPVKMVEQHISHALLILMEKYYQDDR